MRRCILLISEPVSTEPAGIVGLFPLALCKIILNKFDWVIWQGLSTLFELSDAYRLSDFLLPWRCHNYSVATVNDCAYDFPSLSSFLCTNLLLPSIFSHLNHLFSRLKTPSTCSLVADSPKISVIRQRISAVVNHSPFPSLVTI